MKRLLFEGRALDDLRNFPIAAKREAGFQLDRVQHGLDPKDWKPMKSIGSGVREVRIRANDGAFRVIYTAMVGDAVWVLHAFQKKTERTEQRHIEIARQRFKAIGD
ncbi:MAG: type II toxin-antitoxin system RelE/ParE family toxin [Mariprofundales bacterium]|nr:type II toxin-antitoxin system RelE/ParE family toxin [Mariprofundales bacterium]